MKNYNEIITKL